jgi:hypothetical protein
VLAPSLPPGLRNVSVAGNSANVVVTFETNLPVRRSPLGAATIAISRIAVSAGGRSMDRFPELSLASEMVAEGPVLTLLPEGTSPVPEMTEITRRTPGADGFAEYTARMATGPQDGVILVTDPLGRVVTQQFP